VPQQTAHARDFRLPGSTRAHDALLRACEAWLKLQGIPVAVINQRPVQRKDGSWSSPGASVGLADLVACVPPTGRLLLLEVKSARSRPRPAQIAAAGRWTKAGAQWALVRDVAELPGLLGVGQ